MRPAAHNNRNRSGRTLSRRLNRSHLSEHSTRLDVESLFIARLFMPDAPLHAKIALAALASHLDDYDQGTRQRARPYVKGRAILDLWEDGDILTAHIQGTGAQPYTTTLQFDGQDWNPDCSCPVGSLCKHAYALGSLWLDHLLGGSSRQILADHTHRRATASPPPHRGSFRQIWETQLAATLGRALTAEEGRLLGQLSALFQELQQLGRLTRHALYRHGLSAAGKPPDDEFWEPAFPDWWPPGQSPADPWALWRYVALSWEHAGRPLPAAFASQTDLTAVRQRIADIFVAADLQNWRNALPPPAPPPDALLTRAASSTALYDDLRIILTADGTAQLLAHSTNGKPWRAPTQAWLRAVPQLDLTAINAFAEPARSVLLHLRLAATPFGNPVLTSAAIPPDLLAQFVADPATRAAITLPDGAPWHVEDAPLELHARPLPNDPAHLALELRHPAGHTLPANLTPILLDPAPLYLIDQKLWRGPRPLPTARLPVAALRDPDLSTRLHTLGLRLPATLEAKFVHVSLRPRLQLWLTQPETNKYLFTPELRARLIAEAPDPPVAQHWTGLNGWQWLPARHPPTPTADSPHYQFNLAAANTVSVTFPAFRLQYSPAAEAWSRPVTSNFPEDFLAWRATLPPDLTLEATPDLAGLLGEPLRARYLTTAKPATSSGQDWFDITVALQPEDTTLTDDELRVLLAAKGKWVRLAQRGWQRLAIDDTADAATRAALTRLGLAADLAAAGARPETHRFHALQLTEVPLEDATLTGRLRERAATLRAVPPPPLPAGLHATLRPYQEDGYHYLAHLSTQGLGGVLADDMGLGKTLQTLAWLLWLRSDISNLKSQISNSDEVAAPFRALIVCPKSVVPNWQSEAARFTPALSTARLAPGEPPAADATLLVVNYAQLRLRAKELTAIAWDAVVLDEGQNIKNPASATARTARELRARHRVVLTGTPIENRVLDLWSLLAFAQPGLLGGQASFTRNYRDQDDPADVRGRLATRVRPFLLRRTKSQVARDLPPRTEEDLTCELEGPQRTLYDAELKRARQLLLEVKSARQFDAARFNILQSLLRLRQICCDPRLVGAGDEPTPSASTKTAHASAKLEALLDTLEPLVAEGHRVLVFSQFVGMLELIRAELISRSIEHLMLTGQTENRQELVQRFQAADGPPVFLLSLKAAGSGLNLTAASYVVLYDPWWNPAVEAQAIDRTHRIGQTNPVIAYRLIARDTVEEKIRALQREKAALAAAVVQEESLSTVMDLDTLRTVLG